MWDDVRQLNLATGALLVLLAVIVGICALIWQLRDSAFALKEIVLRGDLRHVTAPSVRATAVPQLRGGFFTADLGDVRRAFETVPWVRRATVSRHWPDALVVDIEEHVPLARWADGRGVDTDGELFAVNSAELDQYEDLPALEGPPGTEHLLTQRLHDFTQWFKPLGRTPEAVTLSNRYAWSLTLDDGMVVDLGREQATETLGARISRLVAAFDQVRTRWGGTPDTVDLRYPNGFAVRVAGVKFLAPKGAQTR